MAYLTLRGDTLLLDEVPVTSVSDIPEDVLSLAGACVYGVEVAVYLYHLRNPADSSVVQDPKDPVE